MAAVAGPLHPIGAMTDDHVMDTRTPSPVQRTTTVDSKTEDYKPDLSAEVALLSTKLVNAINYNTTLDDTLQASRHELEQQRQKCATLEVASKRHEELLASGVLVKKAETDKVIAKLRAELTSERAAREAAEKAKKQTEGELENLTSALFEEANAMVAAARKDSEALERRNSQLRSQLQDTEMLLTSQQAQLQDLKETMEKLEEAQPGRSPSMPSTPITANHAGFEALQLSPRSASVTDLSPEHPLHFSHLISPVLRSDTAAYNDFQDLLLLARRLGAHSRNPSGHGGQQSGSLSTHAAMAAASSSPNLPGAFSFSNNSSPVSGAGGASAGTVPPLKDSKFYKRALTEDIEPTLRLDTAPGLSFLSRRTVLGSLLAGTLAVEPYPQNKHYFACTLCGESRRTEQCNRKYRFRTSEDDTVSKPLCDYCVSRLRATCDFVGFMRMVRDGYWRCDNEEDQKTAWEESVRLRERMFWSRIGGGVVPCQQSSHHKVDETPSSGGVAKNGRSSLESIPENQAKGPTGLAPPGTKATDPDISEENTSGGIGEAIVRMSSRAAAVSTPEMQPIQTPPADPVTPPQNATTPAADEDSDASATDPPTPFEDASQELDLTVDTAETDEQLKQELEATVESAKKDVEQTPAIEASVEGEPYTTSSITTLHPPTASSTETTPRNSFQGDVERKSSSVQDRIRALRAAAGQ